MCKKILTVDLTCQAETTGNSSNGYSFMPTRYTYLCTRDSGRSGLSLRLAILNFSFRVTAQNVLKTFLNVRRKAFKYFSDSVISIIVRNVRVFSTFI